MCTSHQAALHSFVSHDLNFLSQTVDRIIIMENGKIVQDGTHELINAEMVKKYFGCEVMESRNIYNGRVELHLFPEN